MEQLNFGTEELANLKQQVEQTKQLVSKEFQRLQSSIVFREGPDRGKAFAVSLHHIKQLATTPVGFGLRLGDCVEFT